MARSVGEIYDRMIEAKESFSTLNSLEPDSTGSGQDSYEQFQQDLMSSSNVATWRMIFGYVAVIIHNAEVLIDEVLRRVKERVSKSSVGILPWYARVAKQYRHGYTLQLVQPTNYKETPTYRYSDIAIDDQAAAIVKRASAVDVTGEVRVKVAKLDNSGEPTALTSSERNGVQQYFDQVAIAGIHVNVITGDPDEVRLEMEVIYDPTIIDATNGQLINDPQQQPVNDAVKGYIQNIPFDSRFILEDMMAEVRAAQGVINARLWRARARPDGASQWEELFDVTGSGPVKPKNYTALVGHLRLDQIGITYTKG